MHEKRSHCRLEVNLPIQIWRAGAQEPIAASFKDLSWGGGSFTSNEPDIQVGERLVVCFPWVNGKSLNIESEVIRSERLDSGEWRVRLRFVRLSHAEERQLIKLLSLLASRGQAAAKTSRLPLVPVLEVILDDQGFEDTLVQIAEGRLMITVVGTGYQTGQYLLLRLGRTQESKGFSLRACIERVTEIPPLDPFAAAGRPPVMELELRLAHPLAELRKLVETLRQGDLRP